MNDDLIKRLRAINVPGMEDPDEATILEAAAALAEAEAEVERLRAVLSRINDKAIMNAGEFARYVREECAALAHPIADEERVAQGEGE